MNNIRGLLQKTTTTAWSLSFRSSVCGSIKQSSSSFKYNNQYSTCNKNTTVLSSYRSYSSASVQQQQQQTSNNSQTTNIPYQILSISPLQWEKNIGSETISNELKDHFDLIGSDKDRSTLLRTPAFQAIEWLNRMKQQNFVKNDKSDYSCLIDGKRGSGKSVVMSQLAFWAKQQGWLVFYVPDCYKFIHTGTLQPFTENPMLFEQNDLSSKLLAHMIEVNGEILKNIPLKTRFRIQHNGFKSSSEKTLYDLASSSMLDCASEVLNHFKKELDAVTEYPVLILLDGYNHFHRVSGYGDMYNPNSDFNTLPTDRLLASKLFKPLHNHSLSNGVVIASTTDEVGKQELLEEFDQENIIKVEKFTLYEMRLLLNYLVDIDYLEKVPSQETVQYLWQMSSGNARDVWKFISLL